MKKLITLFCLSLSLSASAMTFDYGCRFTAGNSGTDLKSAIVKDLHAGIKLDLTEKMAISLNAVVAPEKWIDIKNFQLLNLNPTMDITISHHF